MGYIEESHMRNQCPFASHSSVSLLRRKETHSRDIVELSIIIKINTYFILASNHVICESTEANTDTYNYLVIGNNSRVP